MTGDGVLAGDGVTGHARGGPGGRWLVTGAAGMLGRALVTVLAETQATQVTDVTGLDRDELDITDQAAVADAVAGYDVVLNAAAHTAVDAAESDEEAAVAVNATGVRNVAEACRKAGAALVHVSTDYVFDGTATEPYAEDAAPAPRSAYGRSKLAGEQAVLSVLPAAYVVRTAWLYGEHGPNFVRTIMRLERERDTLDVVDDQRGQPTWSLDLARGLVALALARPAPGVYHCVNGGETTWYGLARAVFAELGADPDRVRPTTTDRFPRPAPRPAYSVLATGRWTAAGLPQPRDWRQALHAALRSWGWTLGPYRPS
jgi:dTDP-4-dehydrorhamnose reductase